MDEQPKGYTLVCKRCRFPVSTAAEGYICKAHGYDFVHNILEGDLSYCPKFTARRGWIARLLRRKP